LVVVVLVTFLSPQAATVTDAPARRASVSIFTLLLLKLTTLRQRGGEVRCSEQEAEAPGSRGPSASPSFRRMQSKQQRQSQVPYSQLRHWPVPQVSDKLGSCAIGIA
jgi:hypothetical protein